MSLGLNQIIKLTSNENNITATQNRVSFTIPANSGNYDLSKSYINLNCSVLSDQTGVQMPQVMINDDSNAADNTKAFNIAIVKNAVMGSAKGSIANIRRVDLLRNTLNYYTLTTDEMASEDYFSLFQSYGPNQQLGSIFRNIYKEGGEQSSNKQGVVKIPVHQLFNFGKNQNYSSQAFGRTDINLELNLDKLSITNYLGAASGNSWSRQDRNMCQSLTATLGANSQTLYSSRSFYKLEDSPYWVNQQIVVAYTDTASADQTVTKTITDITFRTITPTATQGTIELTLDSPLQAAALTGAQTLTAISCTGVDAVFSFVMENAELVLEKLPDGTPSDDVINYTEFVSEVHTVAAQSNFQKQFFVEPQAMNLYVMAGGSYVSKKNDISEWRFRLNNEDLTNRKVEYHSPLALDRIGMCFNNSNLPFHNANEIYSDTPTNQIGHTTFPASFADANKILLACNPMPMSEEQKMVQVNITSTSADITNLTLYKELVLSLNA
tara:strand:+ start:3122 stop:4606 length:1485 start_codon:yes stop_codon:yes gene_type:complete